MVVRSSQLLGFGSWLAAHFVAFGSFAFAAHDHAPGTGVQSLDVYANGTAIDRLTGESAPSDNGWQVMHARSIDGGANWTEPVRVDHGLPPPHSLHRGMDAQLASAGDRIIAAWTKAGTDKWGSGPIV